MGGSLKLGDGCYTHLNAHCATKYADTPQAFFIDHINHNGLDNRKANLRPAMHWQNVCNRPKSPRTKSRSKYKGLTWHKRKGKWHVRIRFKGHTESLGYFDNETDAAAAYDQAAKRYHGRFAILNFPRVQ